MPKRNVPDILTRLAHHMSDELGIMLEGRIPDHYGAGIETWATGLHREQECYVIGSHGHRAYLVSTRGDIAAIINAINEIEKRDGIVGKGMDVHYPNWYLDGTPEPPLLDDILSEE